MPCYSCSTEFGFLRKEIGCDVCGFSFCSRCCKKREVLLSKQETLFKQFICNKCYNTLNGTDTKVSKTSPPLAHKKRMASLRSCSVDSASSQSLSSEWSSEKDKEIIERLQRLKKDRVKAVLPSEEDIAERLAILKGIEPAKYKAPPIEVYRPPDFRTAAQQAADLMKQVTLEAELDSRLVKPEDEIAARLARLRDETPGPEKIKSPEKSFLSNLKTEQPFEEMDIDQAKLQWQKEDISISKIASKEAQSLIDDPEYKKLMMDIQKGKDSGEDNYEDEEAAANELVEKLMATADIDEEELESLNDDTEESNSKSEKDTTEEFPWCVICTEDAKIRCFDCDSDIYCLRCFKECHDTLEIEDHKTCPYLPVKSSST